MLSYVIDRAGVGGGGSGQQQQQQQPWLRHCSSLSRALQGSHGNRSLFRSAHQPYATHTLSHIAGDFTVQCVWIGDKKKWHIPTYI